MDELLEEFITETNENLTLLDSNLIKLEKNPNDHELLAQIFRIVHTVKGTCGFLNLDRLQKVAHSAENVLGRLRDKELKATPEIISAVLEALDCIKEIIHALEQTQKEPIGDDHSLITKLDDIALLSSEDTNFRQQENNNFLEKPETQDINIAQKPYESSPKIDNNLELYKTDRQEIISSQKKTVTSNKPIEKVEEADLIEKHSRETSVSNQTIRVNVDLLEKLMTLVSELVLTRNQLLQIARRAQKAEFNIPLQHLSHITSELQEGVMKTRMQPIGNAWAKLPRMLRDLSQELGKQINLQMIGAETELDRQVLELIKDPLTHMVRNAADHGIEKPTERRAVDKNEVGQIILEAYHQGGHIIIKIQDDGKGIDIEKVKQRSIELNFTTESEIASLPDQQILQFIFRPGFSTAKEITAISGRGVGLDVVKSNIEKIGGTIDFHTIKGRGSAFIIKIPLTLAIVSSLIVECASQSFAIPQLNILELVKTSKNSDCRIETINESPLLRLRGKLLPLISLRNILRLNDETDKRTDEPFVVVIQVGSQNFGLIVDQVFDTEEIVVKPVSPLLRELTFFSGNTILGDGRVIFILDPNGLANASGLTITKNNYQENNANLYLQDEQKIDILLFRSCTKNLKAIPLSLISRLEEINVDAIEHKEEEFPLVQYRGKLMPLISISPSQTLKKSGEQPILVFSEQDRYVGLLVDEIIDIVKDQLNIQVKERATGFLGSAIIAGNAVDIVDVSYFLTKIYHDWFEHKNIEPKNKNSSKKRILFVDDSHFFRNLLVPFLSGEGYHVTAVASPQDALALYEQNVNFDIIITDIEMPGMSGFEFAEKIQNLEKWKQIPIIALSAFTQNTQFQEQTNLGIQNYIDKLDRETLLKTLEKLG